MNSARLVDVADVQVTVRDVHESAIYANTDRRGTVLTCRGEASTPESGGTEGNRVPDSVPE